MLGLVLDIETTAFLKTEEKNGLTIAGPGSDILEVGYIMIDMDTNAFVKTGTLYFYKPTFNIENPDAQAKHKLTREFLKQYENDFNNNLNALNAMTRKAVIIGKNSDAFDIPYIKAFINKYSGNLLNISRLCDILTMKAYYNGYVYFNDSYRSVDLQKIWAPRYRALYQKKYGISTNKKGKLEEYIDVLDAWDVVKTLYNDIPNKARVTQAHGALYDCVMTYVVWYDAKANGMVSSTGEVLV